MPLFFIPGLTATATHATLSEEDSKHAVKVLRMPVGASLTLTDGCGGEYEAVIEDAHAKHCRVAIKEYTEHSQRPYSIHIAIAPTKNIDRTEYFVEKAVELGIERISFIKTSNSERKNINLERIERIALSAIKQSKQFHMPILQEMTSYEDFLASIHEKARFIAYVPSRTEATHLMLAVPKRESVCILIGPEGDFSPAEIQQALSHGFSCVHLGQNVLRTETAALVACHSVHLANIRS